MVNVAKIGTATREIGAWLKAGGYKYVAETKPTIFHGINPKLTYPPSGKSFELPRFCTQEMQQARRLNKIAIQEAKAGTVEYTYPKATAEDLRRLTSPDIAESYSRVTWTNPKDGNVYHLLKQGKTPDGKVIIRILDQDGAFIKEAEIVPKKILIVDDFTNCNKKFGYMTEHKIIPHGQGVETFARRYNPFAIYEQASIVDGKSLEPNKLKYVIEKLKSDNSITLVNCSWGSHLSKYEGELLKVNKSITSNENLEFLKKFIQEYEPEYYRYMSELDKLCKDGKIRVLRAIGNGGKDELNIESLLFPHMEFVGSISKKGKVSEFSGMRNSKYTQHYEVGEYSVNGTEKGFNLTGKHGTEIPYPKKDINGFDINYEDFIGKSIDEYKLDCINLKKLLHEDYYTAIEGKLIAGEDVLKVLHINPKPYLGHYYYQNSGIYDSVYSCGTNKKIMPYMKNREYNGTSFSTPIRTAKLALNDMMEGVI